MKKEKLLEILKQIPDGEDVRYAYRDSCGDAADADDFQVVKLYERNGSTPIYFINEVCGSGVPYGFITESQFESSQKVWELRNSFPANENTNWTIHINSYNDSIEVEFKKANFRRKFGIELYARESIFRFYVSGPNYNTFTNWEDFFNIVKPVLRKELQKYREELEILVEDGI